MKSSHKLLGGLAVSLAALTLAIGPALATDGMFSNGFGARQKALAGAGVADSTDATAASLNPAGLVHLERNEASIAASAFSPRRKYSSAGLFDPAGGGTSTVNTPGATSGKNWFVAPNLALAIKTDNPYFDVMALTVYGNGGMNTQYKPGANVFGGGQAGINLEQAIISLAVAKQIGNVSVGIAPAIARQVFRAKGLQNLQAAAVPGTNISDLGNDVSWGYGLRYGVEWAVKDHIRVGFAGNTRFKMSAFDKYNGLFAQRGDLDIPASIQAGIAIDVLSNLTVMADYKHIFYSDVKAIGNPSTNIAGCLAGNVENCFGGQNGPGFGWKDMDIIKLGVEWDAMDDLTVRAGYSYGTQPVRSRDVTLNILAPAVVQHHLTAGIEYDVTDDLSFELTGMYAPETSVTGTDIFTGVQQTISMKQYEITAGVKYKFGEETHQNDDD